MYRIGNFGARLKNVSLYDNSARENSLVVELQIRVNYFWDMELFFGFWLVKIQCGNIYKSDLFELQNIQV